MKSVQSKHGGFSGPYFPAFGLNAERSPRISPYSVRMRENTDQKNLLIWTLFTQLIYKVKLLGISGSLLKLIQSYLDNRFQRVLLNGRTSEWKPIKSRVPQSSFL